MSVQVFRRRDHALVTFVASYRLLAQSIHLARNSLGVLNQEVDLAPMIILPMPHHFVPHGDASQRRMAEDHSLVL